MENLTYNATYEDFVMVDPCDGAIQSFLDAEKYFYLFYAPLLWLVAILNVLLVRCATNEQKKHWTYTKFYMATFAVLDILMVLYGTVPRFLQFLVARQKDASLTWYASLFLGGLSRMAIFCLAGWHQWKESGADFWKTGNEEDVPERPSVCCLALEVIATILTTNLVLFLFSVAALSIIFAMWHVYFAALFAIIFLLISSIFHVILYRKASSISHSKNAEKDETKGVVLTNNEISLPILNQSSMHLQNQARLSFSKAVFANLIIFGIFFIFGTVIFFLLLWNRQVCPLLPVPPACYILFLSFVINPIFLYFEWGVFKKHIRSYTCYPLDESDN